VHPRSGALSRPSPKGRTIGGSRRFVQAVCDVSQGHWDCDPAPTADSSRAPSTAIRDKLGESSSRLYRRGRPPSTRKLAPDRFRARSSAELGLPRPRPKAAAPFSPGFVLQPDLPAARPLRQPRIRGLGMDIIAPGASPHASASSTILARLRRPGHAGRAFVAEGPGHQDFSTISMRVVDQFAEAQGRGKTIGDEVRERPEKGKKHPGGALPIAD